MLHITDAAQACQARPAGSGARPSVRLIAAMDAASYSVEETLRDGGRVWIRAVRPDDRPAFLRAFARLSERTIYHRFFQAKPRLTERELRYLTDLDFRDHVALVAEIESADGRREGIGVGRFVRVHPPQARDRAEVAFTVDDQHQGRGVASHLLDHLARIARGLGYVAFEADVLPDNRPMLEVFQHSGLRMREDLEEGLVKVVLEL